MARSPSPHARVHQLPRISANDLARYMVSSPTAQIGIIRRARESLVPPRARYSTARQELRAYLSDTGRASRQAIAIRNRFQQRADDPSLDAWTREDARLSIDLMDAFLRMENKIAGLRFEPAPRRQPPLALAGVEVSVSLDLFISRSRANQDEVGGVLFRLTKADDSEAAMAKRNDMGGYAATLAFMQARATAATGKVAHHQLCASIDIQAGDVHYATRSYQQKMTNLESACRIIAAMWNVA